MPETILEPCAIKCMPEYKLNKFELINKLTNTQLIAQEQLIRFTNDLANAKSTIENLSHQLALVNNNNKKIKETLSSNNVPSGALKITIEDAEDDEEENEKLKEEIKMLKEENENSIELQAYEGYKIEYEKLEKENKMLKETLKENEKDTLLENQIEKLKQDKKYLIDIIDEIKDFFDTNGCFLINSVRDDN